MSFLFPTRAKVNELPPQHRDLILSRTLGVRQAVPDWEAFLASIARHDEVTGGREKYALEPAFLEVVVPLLRVLCVDAKPGTAVALSFDGYGPQGRFGPRQPLPDRGRRRRVRQAWAFVPVLQAEIDVRDGTHVLLRVIERTRMRTWTQRSSSGKWKPKSRYKVMLRYEAVVTLPKGRQPRRPAAPEPPWLRTVVKEKNRSTVAAALKTPQPMRLEAALDVIAAALRWSPTAQLTQGERS